MRCFDMAFIFKQRRRKPIPETAEIVRRRGRTVARWTSSGRTYTAEVDGDSIITQGRTYKARWRDANGIMREASTGCTSADMAESWLAEKVADVERVKSGVVSASEAATAEKSTGAIAEAVAAFGDDLKARRRTAAHIQETQSIVTRCADGCGWHTLANMDGIQAGTWLRGLLDDGKSARTYNKHCVALKSFGTWCVKQRLLVSNPFQSLSRMSEKADRRYERRTLTTGEVTAIIETARIRPVIESAKCYKRAALPDHERARLEWKGWNRALCYRLMSVSGLRYGEARALRLADVSITSDTPHITIQAQREKARRGAQIPLHGAIVDELASFITAREKSLVGDSSASIVAFPGTAKDAPLFDDLPVKISKQFKGDCEAAGVDVVDASGRVVDVHCLRYYFGTELARAGVPLHVVQKLMRHSTPTLTSTVYVHSTLTDLGAAVDMLPDTGATATKKQATASSENLQTEGTPKGTPTDGKTLHTGATSVNLPTLKSAGTKHTKTPANRLFTGVSTKKRLVNGVGLEPTATGLKVRCSTN